MVCSLSLLHNPLKQYLFAPNVVHLIVIPGILGNVKSGVGVFTFSLQENCININYILQIILKTFPRFTSLYLFNYITYLQYC